MSPSDQNQIQREATLDVPRARLWRALTDHEEFGQWFGVRLEAPFRVGEEARGQITHPGYEHMTLRAQVDAIEPEKRFVFRWQPHAVDPELDTSGDPYTTIEFRLTEAEKGTHLRITESGFDDLPERFRAQSYERNSQGWSGQIQSIEKFVTGG